MSPAPALDARPRTAAGPADAPPADTSGPLLTRAARAARAGRYAEAERLLAGLDGDPAALDLRARIHAQRGELAEADACWAAVQAALTTTGDPGPASAATAATAATAARRRIAATHARRYRPSAGRRWAVGAAVLTVAGAVVAGVLLPRTETAEPPAPDPAVARDLAAVRAQEARVESKLTELRSQLDEAVRTRPRAPLTSADLAGPGVTVTPRDGALHVTFAEGLFGDDVTLTPSGQATLAALAERLRQAAVTGPLVVTGHTDDSPLPAGSPWADRVTLGFARAQRAAEVLAAAGPVPLPSFGLRSTGTANPPYPDDSPADRARNNTVTLLIPTT